MQVKSTHDRFTERYFFNIQYDPVQLTNQFVWRSLLASIRGDISLSAHNMRYRFTSLWPDVFVWQEAYLIQRRLEVEVNLLRSERIQIDQQVHNMEVRIRSLDHRNSELKVIIDRATCKGGLLHTFNQLEEANARVVQLQQENKLLQHHLNMVRTSTVHLHAELLLIQATCVFFALNPS